MNQVFLLTIANGANKITFVQCFNYEFSEYNCFMPEGKHIWFYNEQEAKKYGYRYVLSQIVLIICCLFFSISKYPRKKPGLSWRLKGAQAN